MYAFYVSKFSAECISDKVNKIKFLKKMNRVASWEDCREMCNTNDECIANLQFVGMAITVLV